LPSDGGDASAKNYEEPHQEFDFSKVNPEDFVCFGTIEPGHPECEKCPFKDSCAKKAGIKM